jgi:hypothetical protein
MRMGLEVFPKILFLNLLPEEGIFEARAGYR